MAKRFLPGTLNPLYEGDSPYDLDISEFNNSSYVQELHKKILEKTLEQDLLAGLTNPKAIILAVAKFSYENPSTDYAIPVHRAIKGKMHTWYHFRIPEIHSHLEDPCNPRLLRDPNARSKVFAAIQSHPIAPFLSPDPHTEPPAIRAGSIVEINYDRGPDVGMALFPRISKVVGSAYGLPNFESCLPLLNAFAQAAYGTVGSSGTAHPTEPPCPDCKPYNPTQKCVDEYNDKGPRGGRGPYELNQKHKDFYTKLKNSKHFKDFSPAVLAGIAANGWAESKYVPAIGGDAISWYRRKYNDNYVTPYANGTISKEVFEEATKKFKKKEGRSIKGKCSFGYWQMNICPDDGGGSEFLQSRGIYGPDDTPTEEQKKEAYAAITNPDNQFEHMAKKMKTKFPNDTWKTSTDPYAASYNITVNYERPECKHMKAMDRSDLATKIYDEIA